MKIQADKRLALTGEVVQVFILKVVSHDKNSEKRRGVEEVSRFIKTKTSGGGFFCRVVVAWCPYYIDGVAHASRFSRFFPRFPRKNLPPSHLPRWMLTSFPILPANITYLCLFSHVGHISSHHKAVC